MFPRMSKELVSILLPAIALVTPAMPVFADSHTMNEPTATIDIRNWRVGFILGYGGGKGRLHHEGKTYPLKISGLRVGALAGIAKTDLSGDVFNLTKPEDIEGVYSAGSAAVAVVAGGKVWTLENSKGVILQVKGKQKGVELALDMSGMSISLRDKDEGQDVDKDE